MSRREFLRNISATAVAGGLLGASQASGANRPRIGYFDPPDDPLADRLDRPWEMTEAEWTEILGRVSPGRRLKPDSWPGGSRLRSHFRSTSTTKSALSQAATLHQADLPGASAAVVSEYLAYWTSWRGTTCRRPFYIPAVVSLIDPDETRRIAGGGHEVGLHGWIHANNSRIDRATEREIMLQAREVLQRVSGRDVVGHRSANFDMSPNTIELVAELGLEYDSSMMADDSCYELLLAGRNSGIVEVPVEWVRDDAVYLSFSRGGARPWLSPADVFGIFKDELEAAAADGDVFQLLMHPHVIGHRSRVWIIDEIIKHAKSLGGAWFGTHAQVARWARENAA